MWIALRSSGGRGNSLAPAFHYLITRDETTCVNLISPALSTLKQALQLNQSRIVKKPEELAQLLREGSHELRALFAAHADHTTGKVSDGRTS